MKLLLVLASILIISFVGIEESFAQNETVKENHNEVCEDKLCSEIRDEIKPENKLHDCGYQSFSSFFCSNLTIDNPPKLGETAEITLKVFDTGTHYSEINHFRTLLKIPNGFDLVSGELDTIHQWKKGETVEVKATIKAIQTGNWTIQGVGHGGTSDFLNLVVLEDNAYIHEGYFPSEPSYAIEIDPTNISITSINSTNYKRYCEISENRIPSIQTTYPDKSKIMPRPPESKYDYSSLQKEIRATPPLDKFVKLDGSSSCLLFNPKIQLDKGISLDQIICNEGLELVLKTSNHSPACVKPTTSEKLFERGWALSNLHIHANTNNSIPSIQSSLILYPFEGFVRNSVIVVLATVESTETKLIDTSQPKVRTVMADGYKEALDVMREAQWNNDDYDGPNSIEIYLQYATNQTITISQEEHRPFQLVTLSIDKYIKDETEKFEKMLVVLSDANGEGTRNNESYNFYTDSATEFTVGDQSLFIINELNPATKNAIEEITYDETFLGISGLSGKYDIQEDGTIQSKYNQYFLKNHNDFEVSEMRKQIQTNSTFLENLDRSILWNLPMTLDEAIKKAEQVVKQSTAEELTEREWAKSE